MTTTVDNTDLAIAARASSATVRASLTRLRASMEIVTDRLATLSKCKRRQLIARGCTIVIDSWKVREAASRLPKTATSMPFLIQIETETASLMNSGAAYLHRLTENHYLGHSPLDTALMVARDLEFTEPPRAKANGGAGAPSATERQRAARTEFDRARDGVRPKIWIAKAHLLKTKSAEGAPMISGVASSTAIDLSNERFNKTCLKMMAEAFPGKNLWLDHSYKIAEDLAGRMTTATIKKNGDDYDLLITAELNPHNARAMQVYAALKDGYSAGLSVGVIVLEQRRTEEQNNGREVWEITNCNPLEVSLCGIPAQPRANTTGAKSAKERAELKEMYAI